MSWRIHVLGAYGATEAEFRRALDSIGEDGAGSNRFRIGSSGQWQWANASVWHIDGSAIDQALSSLSVPALRVTSSDAVLWMLTLTRPDRDAFHGVHDFTAVGYVPEDPPPEADADADFPENELEEVAGINRFEPELEFLWDADEAARIEAENANDAEATVPGLEEYTDYGVTLPAAVIEEMKRRPHCAYYTAFMAHGPQIVEALKDFGFDFDPQAMLELLTIGPRTSIEHSDIGNMPRFLELLGIKGVFAQLEEPEEVPPGIEEVDWSKSPSGELFEEFDRLLTQSRLSEVAGGPVELTRISWLHVLTFHMAKYPNTLVRMDCHGPGSEPPRAWSRLGSGSTLEFHHQGGEWQFCFPSSHLDCLIEYEDTGLEKLDEAVGSPPDGTRFEIAFIVEGLREPCHRYAGTFHNRRFFLEQAYPAVKIDVLNDALALTNQVFGSTAIALNSEAETAIVRRNYLRAQKTPPKIRNGKIMPKPGSRHGVIRTLFFERFEKRSPWDIASSRAQEEESWREYEGLCRPTDERTAESVEDVSAEADQEAPEDEWSKFSPGDLFEKFDRLAADGALTEISGGPVEVTHAVLLHLMTHLLCEDLPTSVRIEFPDASLPGESWQELDSLEVRRRGRQWQFCFPTPHWWFGVEDREELDTNRLAAALGSPPDGTRLEFTLLVAGLSDQCHRYAGIYRNQRLEVNQAFPALAADVLTDALALVDQLFSTKSIELADGEVDIVKRNYERSESETPRIRKGKIKPDPGGRKVVVQTLLFERFASRGPWDIAGARELEEERWREFEEICNPSDGPQCNDDEASGEPAASSEEIARLNEMIRKMKEAKELMEAAKVVPHSDEVIYEGRSGKFYRASMSDLEHLSPERLAEHDAAMAALGFRSVGDSACDADQRQSITRCYAGRPEAFGLHSQRKENNQMGWISVPHGMTSVDFSEGENEFRTYFEDDTLLVTTSLDAARSKPEIGLYVRSYEEVSIDRLWEKHLDGIRRFQAHRHTTPVDHTRFADPALRLAKADELICRFMGIS